MPKNKFSKLFLGLILIFGTKLSIAADQTTVAELRKKFEGLEQQAKNPPPLPPKGNLKRDIKPDEQQISQKIQGELNKSEESKVEEKTANVEIKTDTSKEPGSIEKQPNVVQSASTQKMPELKELIDLTKPWGLDLQKVATRGQIYRKTPERNEKNAHEIAIEIDNFQMLKDYFKSVPKAAKDLKKKLDDDRLRLTDLTRKKLAMMNENSLPVTFLKNPIFSQFQEV